MRDALINRPRRWTPDVPVSLYCLWDEKTAYTVADPLTNTIRVTPEFEEFIGKEANWAIDFRILALFPEIEGKVKLVRVEY